jgi:hypothetical protein
MALLQVGAFGQERFSRPPRASRKSNSGKYLQHEPGDVAAPLPCDTCRTFPDLTAVIKSWPTLPDAIRAGIMAMVYASKSTE